LTPLHLACRQHHEKVAISLFKKGTDLLSLTTDNKTPFFFAVQLGMTEVARMMIRLSEADLKLVDMELETSPGKRATALHVTVTSVDVDIAKMLLLEGANILARDSDGKVLQEIITELKSKEAQAEFYKLLFEAPLKVTLAAGSSS
jgi:ankyrin repeat protein